MRTIYYNDEDIKKCKLALVNQNLTSLQSAFLKQYINNLEYELQQKEDIINKARELLVKWGEEPDADMYMQIKEYKEHRELLEILDNKAE